MNGGVLFEDSDEWRSLPVFGLGLRSLLCAGVVQALVVTVEAQPVVRAVKGREVALLGFGALSLFSGWSLGGLVVPLQLVG